MLVGAGWFYYEKHAVRGPILKAASTPSGAEVYVDEAHVGASPVTVNELTPGAHKIRMSMARYMDFEERFFIQTNQPREISAELVPTPLGDLSVFSRPAGADVFVGDRKKGTTPADIQNLPKGTCRVVLKKEGFDSWEGTVQIVPLKKARLSADLVSRYGGLDVSSRPSEAEVWVDEKPVGKTPLALDRKGRCHGGKIRKGHRRTGPFRNPGWTLHQISVRCRQGWKDGFGMVCRARQAYHLEPGQRMGCRSERCRRRLAVAEER